MSLRIFPRGLMTSPASSRGGVGGGGGVLQRPCELTALLPICITHLHRQEVIISEKNVDKGIRIRPATRFDGL
jgi:hypothetical protein